MVDLRGISDGTLLEELNKRKLKFRTERHSESEYGYHERFICLDCNKQIWFESELCKKYTYHCKNCDLIKIEYK